MSKITILLADDHGIVREGTRELLERESDMVVVGEAQDGEEAVALAEKLRPKVVAMDLSMPKMSGIQATRLIKQKVPDTAILVFTAYDDEQYVIALLQAGAAGYLLKNVRGAQLVHAIRAVASGEAVLHPSVASKLIRRVASLPGEGEAVTAKADGPGAFMAEPLTERELEVLNLASKGLSNKEIGASLHISPRTVQVHLARIFGKLGVGSRTEAVIQGVKRGLVRLE